MATKATFTITGDIVDFSRMDNLYKVLKREGEKLLTNWTINVKAEFEEKKEGAGK